MTDLNAAAKEGTVQSIKNFMAVTPGVTVSLLAASLLTGQSASAIDKKQPRAFYLTTTTHFGNQALTACAAGFHMASMWEILDPSNLTYDTTLGYTTGDSGSGPPTDGLDSRGWIRTGAATSTSRNCSLWTSLDPVLNGTFVTLATSDIWSMTTVASPINPWSTATAPCISPMKVWCVED